MRQAELEHRHGSAWSDDAGELAHRGGDVVDIPEEVCERDGVELRVGERQLLGARLAQLDAVAQARTLASFASCGEHLLALVDADDRPAAVGAGKLDRAGGGSTRDVEHAPRLRRDPGHEERAPAWVLAEGEEARVAVVRRAERREELACVARACRGLHGRILAA